MAKMSKSALANRIQAQAVTPEQREEFVGEVLRRFAAAGGKTAEDDAIATSVAESINTDYRRDARLACIGSRADSIRYGYTIGQDILRLVQARR
jgi:hypothetical protein